MKKHMLMSAAAAIGLLALTGCWQKKTIPAATAGPAERAGAVVDQAAADAKALAEKAAVKTGAALEKAGAAMEKTGSDLQK